MIITICYYSCYMLFKGRLIKGIFHDIKSNITSCLLISEFKDDTNFGLVLV